MYIAGLCGLECLSGSSVLLGYAGSEVKWEKSSARHIQKWLYQFQGPCTATAWAKREFRLKSGEDLVVNGLGWVSARRAPLVLRAHFPAGVKLTVRPNLIGPPKKNKCRFVHNTCPSRTYYYYNMLLEGTTMASYVYETALQSASGEQLLTDLRRTVSDLRRTNPELRNCSLADLRLCRSRAKINATFFFQEKH